MTNTTDTDIPTGFDAEIDELAESAPEMSFSRQRARSGLLKLAQRLRESARVDASGRMQVLLDVVADADELFEQCAADPAEYAEWASRLGANSEAVLIALLSRQAEALGKGMPATVSSGTGARS